MISTESTLKMYLPLMATKAAPEKESTFVEGHHHCETLYFYPKIRSHIKGRTDQKLKVETIRPTELLVLPRMKLPIFSSLSTLEIELNIFFNWGTLPPDDLHIIDEFLEQLSLQSISTIYQQSGILSLHIFILNLNRCNL